MVVRIAPRRTSPARTGHRRHERNPPWLVFSRRSTMDPAARRAGQFAQTRDGRFGLSVTAVVGGAGRLFGESGVCTASVLAEERRSAAARTTHSATGSDWTQPAVVPPPGTCVYFLFSNSGLGLRCPLYPSCTTYQQTQLTVEFIVSCTRECPCRNFYLAVSSIKKKKRYKESRGEKGK